MSRNRRGAPRWCGLAALTIALSLCGCWTSLALVVLRLPAAVAAVAAADGAETATVESKADEDDDSAATIEEEEFDEDAIVRETIAAGRGDRDEQGVRDQWLSDEHIGETSQFDSRKQISAEVKRLLRAYGLECEECDHDRAVRKVNAYVRETKRKTKLEREARERRDSWARRIFGALVAVGLSTAYVKRKELGLEFLLRNGNGNGNAAASSADRAELLRRRQQAADAASRRKQREQRERQDHQPTWLDNEKKEVWTAKQEKQFQKALREFAGVRKNERYKLIAEKVHGKSRIECLTHHRMLELLAKQQQQQQQQ